MGIILIKIFKRIQSMFKIIIWKILYRRKILIGKKCVFYPNTHITIERKAQIRIGDNCFFNHNCSLNALSNIQIGNDCIFGEGVKVYDHNHEFKNNALIRKQGFKLKNVKIGNNCWIGSNVIILPGVTIGNNVVIGAGVILTKDIPDNKVIVSNINLKEL